MISTFPYVGPMAEEAYHSDAELPMAALSHSLAHRLISRSPRHAWTTCRKLNSAHVPEEKDIFDRGRAAHAILLEGEEKVSIIDAEDWRSKAAKDARISARAAGYYPVLRKAYDDIRRMADIARDTILKCPDLSGVSLGVGKVENVMIWEEGEGPDRILLRTRPDFFTMERDVLLDYKSTGCAHPLVWARTMLSTGADLQEAMYRRGNEATGGPAGSHFIFIVQENEKPFACAPIALHRSFQAFAEEKVERAVQEWRSCIRTGSWPAYPNRIAYLEPPGWALNAYEEGLPLAELPDDNGTYRASGIEGAL